jgi:hypothetical protein
MIDNDDVKSSIRARIKYRNKNIWICYLCSILCAKCKQIEYKHPTENCFSYESQGREVTFEKGNEWFLIDLHLLHFHEQVMIKKMQDKYLTRLSEYRDKILWSCKLCNPEGQEVSFDRRKEWHLVKVHIKRLHLKEMLQEMREKHIKGLNLEEEESLHLA